ncbi:MAG TPA: YkgJ family cysteine cluster protein [Candidatus Korarchaeota archaeon]|nr:YkgJ family cysteine cluster protein [Candidatus Korarchaeota archaeon]
MRCVPGCHLCCLETEMPLTLEDVVRISKLGYDPAEFAEFRDGALRLRNVGGRCYFLDPGGKCRIYEHRPDGCRAYPVVVDARTGECVLDNLCPAVDTIDEAEFREKCSIAKRVISNMIRE